jgi:hypothetical protein
MQHAHAYPRQVDLLMLLDAGKGTLCLSLGLLGIKERHQGQLRDLHAR